MVDCREVTASINETHTLPFFLAVHTAAALYFTRHMAAAAAIAVYQVYNSSRTDRRYEHKNSKQQRQYNDKRQAVEVQDTYIYIYDDTTFCAAEKSSIQE